MLSDEEKAAIKHIKSELDINEFMPRLVFDDEDIKILISLIEKQSKEIEELKNADLTTVYINGFYDGEKKVKDKIKAKIEAIKTNKLRYFHIAPENWVINILQSLLEKE